MTIYRLDVLLFLFGISSNCCFLTCVQVSQEAGQVVWYSHLFQNFPQFIVIHTVKGFGIVNKAEIDVFLELSCFLVAYQNTHSPYLPNYNVFCWKEKFPHSLTAWDGEWEVIESHQVGLLGNLFKIGLTHWENTSTSNFLFSFSFLVRIQIWWLEIQQLSWAMRQLWDGSLWLRKVECKDRRQPGC